MIRATAIAMLLLSMFAHAAGTVVIRVVQRYSVSCVQTQPRITKNADGTYTRSAANMLAVCFNTVERLEEWTAPPESGGVFIRDMPKEKKP